MDIKAKIDEIVKKLKSDDKLLQKFQSDPVKTLEGILGVDLPDDQVKGLIDGIKAKLTLENASKLAGSLGSLFKK